ncbi:hypothetical protein OCU04_002245 [Sclerotinia nivalis]|uniref:Uncharacterized protein n=1 Tax=Sclerotinia nivalis TaxID=352851 RepID=A0A9X0DQ88_9HELO|nr:hypothetical protein OCU04_002245 [Sclerotinia nivalis]
MTGSSSRAEIGSQSSESPSPGSEEALCHPRYKNDQNVPPTAIDDGQLGVVNKKLRQISGEPSNEEENDGPDSEQVPMRVFTIGFTKDGKT